MSGRELAEFSDYAGLLAAVRNRVRELAIAGEAFDQFAGLPDGYLSKLIGERPERRIGMTSMGPLFQALGVVCVMIEDESATRRLKSRLRPRNGSYVRRTYTQRIVTDREWRKLQKIGRTTRWQKLTPAQRSQVMRMLAKRRWSR